MNMMAESTEPFVLEPGTLYYVAGRGILEFKGEIDKYRLDKAEAQTFKNAKILYRFKPHSIFSDEKKDVHLADYSMRGGIKVYPLPTGPALDGMLRLIRGKRFEEGEASSKQHALPFQLDTQGLMNVARIIRDLKRLPHDPNLPKAKMMLAQVLAHHLDARVAEAKDYIEVLMFAPDLPADMAHLPKDRATMVAIAVEFKANRKVPPEFLVSLAASQVSAHQHTGSGTVKAINPYPVKPSLTQAQDILTQFGRGGVSTESDEASLGEDVSTPAPPPVAIPQARSGFSKASSINSKRVDRAALLTTKQPLYADLKEKFEGKPAMKLIDAGLGVISQGDALDLSRLLLAGSHFSISNVYITKNKLEPRQWSLPKVREFYVSLVDTLADRLSQSDKVELKPYIDELRSKLSVKIVMPARNNVMTGSVTDPAPAAEPVSPPATLISPAPKPPQASADDEMSVTGTFKIDILRNPEEKFDPETEYALDWTLNPDVHLPVALTAAKRLSPIAFKVFTRHHMRGQDYDQIAKDIGTDAVTIQSIFCKAATAVGNALQRQADVVRADAGLDCHKSTLG